jgi:DNA-binding CsgD family transcriptional regulator
VPVGKIRQADMDAGPLRALFDELRRLHRHAGEPSTRDLARRMGKAVVSHATVHSALRGPRLPRWQVLELVVEELHGDVENVRELWLRAREAEDQGDSPQDSPPTFVEPRPLPVEPDPPPGDYAQSPLGSLTGTEAAVARLVADGYTNQQIADLIRRSPHTVDSHLRNIFAKLGINSRVALTRFVLQSPEYWATDGATDSR